MDGTISTAYNLSFFKFVRVAELREQPFCL